MPSRHVPRLPRALHERSRRLLLLMACLGLLATACGDEQTPAVAELSLRELLGMSPERVAELSHADRRMFATRLGEAWDLQIAEPVEPLAIQLPEALRDEASALQSPLAFVQASDAERAAAGLEVQVLGQIDADGVDAILTQIPVPAQALGLSFDGTAQQVAPPDEAPVFVGELVVDEGWGRADEEALSARSQREVVAELEPVWRRTVALVAAVDGPAVRVAPAPRAPFALWYATTHRALLVNPNLLYLLDADAFALAARTSSTLVTTAHALELAFIDQCIADQQSRCEACFGPNGNPNTPTCLPLLAASTDAAAECDALSAQGTDGIELYCYNRFLQQNLGCFLAFGLGQTCGTTEAPFDNVEALQNLRPMLTEEACQQALDECQSSRLNPSLVPDNSDPPPVDGSSRGGTNSAWSSACLSECLAVGCDIGLSVLTQMACEACSESAGDSGDGGGGCGSACEGDGMQARGRSGPTAAAGFVFVLPFFFLFGVWWRGRREDATSSLDAFTPPAEPDDSHLR